MEQDTESYLNKGCEEDIPSDSTAVLGQEVRPVLLLMVCLVHTRAVSVKSQLNVRKTSAEREKNEIFRHYLLTQVKFLCPQKHLWRFKARLAAFAQTFE